MPRYHFSIKDQAFVKECSCCGEVSIGTTSEDESLILFLKDFAGAGPSSGMADGLQSRCRACNTRSRRELGITLTEIRAMWEAQNGQCAICTSKIFIDRYTDPKSRAHVDHDSSAGHIRELLCSACNQGIGLLKHDPNILRAAITYLNKHIPSLRRRA